jgi:hypothetical protein
VSKNWSREIWVKWLKEMEKRVVVSFAVNFLLIGYAKNIQRGIKRRETTGERGNGFSDFLSDHFRGIASVGRG